MNNKTLDYPYIRAWGRILGSYAYYIDSQVAQAREDKAPQDATYKGHEGNWRTLADVTNTQTRALLEEIITGAKP